MKTIQKLWAVSARMNQRRLAHYGHAMAKPVNMNEMPQPQGSWQELYNANQRRFNLHLLLGTVFTIFTGVVTYQTVDLHTGPKIGK